MLADKIIELRGKNKFTQAELAKKIGVSKSTIANYESGYRNPDNKTLIKIANVFNVSTDELLGIKQASEYMPLYLSPISAQKIPLLGDIACGSPIEASEELGVYIEANSPITADFCLRCKGDSMIGSRIYDGDIVFIRKQEMVENGEIAAVIIDDEATLKKVYYHPENNMFILKASNDKYDDLIYTGEKLDHIRILGKAVSFYSEIK